MTATLATFRTDITPPLGYPLCGGWLGLAKGLVNPLSANGIVICGAGAPIVLCVLDWCELCNTSYDDWREALAAAAGTTADRVGLHCMHPHLTPWLDSGAQTIADETGLPPVMEIEWCDQMMRDAAASAQEATGRMQPLTHIETGKAMVDRVASNRRVMGDNGKIKAVRWTTTRDPEVRAAPEGLIDPWLKTLSFWNGDQKLASAHYYAVHPSSYEDLWISPDFTGLARDRRSEEDDRVPHLYFTECAGNITAGKYNDGNRENRETFTRRIHDAMIASERYTRRVPVEKIEWRTVPITLPPRDGGSMEALSEGMSDGSVPVRNRQPGVMELSYMKRWERPIDLNALHINDEICILQLPGESFIEYQLFAQNLRPDEFVVVPSYTDCGPGYICMKESEAEGGYEPVDSFCSGSQSEGLMKTAIEQLMKRG